MKSSSKIATTALIILVWFVIVYYNTDITYNGEELSRPESGIIGIAFCSFLILLATGIAYVLSITVNKISKKNDTIFKK
jgi:hypothetical protein